MRVLITGGMGVIGAMVTRRFVEEGKRPVVMARTLDTSLIAPIRDRIDIELGDVLDFPRIVSIIQQHGITHICHTAALTGALSAKNPPQSIHVNVIGTLNILEAARLMKVRRVIYTSAKGGYGNITGEYGPPTYVPITEDHPKNPVRIYDSGKLMGEYIGQYYRRTYGLEYAALRFGATFGPGKTARNVGERALVSQIIEGAYAGTSVRIKEGGDVRNEIIYTKDAAFGVFLALTVAELPHDAYNIGMGGVTLKEVAAETRRIIPTADIEVGSGLEYLKGVSTYSVFDHTRAQKDLGFTVQYPLPRTIEDYIETLRHFDAVRQEQEKR